jgi:hypothetical protein
MTSAWVAFPLSLIIVAVSFAGSGCAGSVSEASSVGDAQSLFTLHLLKSKLADYMPTVVVELVRAGCRPGVARTCFCRRNHQLRCAS